MHKSLSFFYPCLQLYQPTRYCEHSSSFLFCEGNIYTYGPPHIPNILWDGVLKFSPKTPSSWDHFVLVVLENYLWKMLAYTLSYFVPYYFSSCPPKPFGKLAFLYSSLKDTFISLWFLPMYWAHHNVSYHYRKKVSHS